MGDCKQFNLKGQDVPESKGESDVLGLENPYHSKLSIPEHFDPVGFNCVAMA